MPLVSTGSGPHVVGACIKVLVVEYLMISSNTERKHRPPLKAKCTNGIDLLANNYTVELFIEEKFESSGCYLN